MALNTSHASGGVLIYSGERILIYYDGCELAFETDNPMPHFKGKKKGRAYLTTHRVIFNSKDSKDIMQSFSIPFYCMKQIELEQPIFGANFIKGKVLAEQGGNWEGSARFKLWFNHGGAIEFGQAMLTAGRMASRHFPQAPPPYTPPSGPYYQAPPPAYSPPQSDLYGFVPYQTFPTAPPSNGVFMTESPPPYPGIDPNAAPYPPPYANGNSADAKAQEAAASAYYNPANPHNVYMPPPPAGGAPGPSAPPSYDEATKKTQ